MRPLAILYATREGHTRRIAEHVAADLRARGHAVDVVDVRAFPPGFSLDRYAAVVLAASVHLGKHEPEMIAFVRQRRAELERVPAAFLSVSNSERTVEDPDATPDARAKATADVVRVLERFFAETDWRPRRVLPVAGALLYTQYGMLIRFVMKQISKREGGPIDTSHDHVLTDWQALDRFTEDFERGIAAPSGP